MRSRLTAGRLQSYLGTYPNRRCVSGAYPDGHRALAAGRRAADWRSDTIIFAHGQDLADWHDYQADNEKFNYLKSKGFNIYCNVDSSQYFVQCRDNYLRLGRRNLDGYRLYQDAINGGTRTSDLFDAASVWDSRRPTDPSLYDLQ